MSHPIPLPALAGRRFPRGYLNLSALLGQEAAQ